MKNKKFTPLEIFALLVSLVIVCAIGWCVFFSWIHWPEHVAKIEGKSTAEKLVKVPSYEPLNTLFTGLAFVVLLQTIFLQCFQMWIAARMREEDVAEMNRRQRTDEEDRYEERFESRFFRLLEIWNSHVLSLSDGRAHLQGMYAEFFSIWNPADMTDKLATFQTRYAAMFKKHEPVLAPYFRTLYHVFRYIEKSKLKDQTQYSDVVRAMLSGPELAFLAANCLGEYGLKFNTYVNKYHLLKHLPHQQNLPYQEIKDAFSKEAFEDDV